MCARDWLPLSIPSINPAAQLPRAELGLAGQRLRQSPVSKTGSASPARRLGPAGGSRGEQRARQNRGQQSPRRVRGARRAAAPRGAGLGCPHPKWGEGGSLSARSSVPLWGRQRLGNRGAELWQIKPANSPLLASLGPSRRGR